MIRIELDTPEGKRTINYDGINMNIDSQLFMYIPFLERIFELMLLNIKNGQAMEFLKLEENQEENKKKE